MKKELETVKRVGKAIKEMTLAQIHMFDGPNQKSYEKRNVLTLSEKDLIQCSSFQVPCKKKHTSVGK